MLTIDHMDAYVGLDVRNLGGRLARRREALRLDQQDVADRAKMSRAYITRLENGQVLNPKIKDLETVASVLGQSLADVLHEPTTQPKSVAQLRQELIALLGPDRAEEVEHIVIRLSRMPEPEQDLVLKVIRIQVDGWFRTRPTES